ncbi:MAG TPA: hypothetical protein PKI19_08615 [Elusimicrobiales bacterium]|nr:hypothetical protein [Elusimicrobiales bacterium]
MINFQGRLTDTLNNPLEGSHDLVFKIYNVAVAGSPLWSETQNGIVAVNGAFGAQIGGVTPIPAAVFGGASAYLEITVDGTTLSPRERLIAVPYAFNSQLLEGRDYTAFVSTSASQTIQGTKTFTAPLNINSAAGLATTSQPYINVSTNVVVSAAQFRFGNFSTAPSANALGKGAVYYNTSLDSLYVSNGANWVQLAAGGVSPWGESAGAVTLNTNSNKVGLGKAPVEKLDVAGNIKADNGIIAATGEFSGTGADALTVAGGIKAGGVNIIGADGRIPALGAAYIADLDGSALLNVSTAQFAAVAAATTTIAGSLAAEISSRAAADSLLAASTAPLANAGNWDSAYAWGDHASAGYATPAIIAAISESTSAIRANLESVIVSTGELAGGLAAETGSRAAADSALSAQLGTVAVDTAAIAGSLAVEISSRVIADDVLADRLNAVAVATDTLAGLVALKAVHAEVIAATTTLAGSLAAEISARAAADSGLAAQLNSLAASTAPLANAASWDTAYAWGNHAAAGYASLESVAAFGVSTGVIAGNLAAEISARAGADTLLAASTAALVNAANWNTAYSWGDHAAAGYVTLAAAAAFNVSTNTIQSSMNSVIASTGVIAADLAAEISDRGNADNALAGRLNAIAAATTTLAGQAALNSAEVIAATTTIAGNLQSEVSNRAAAVAGEAAARTAADDLIAAATDTLKGQIALKADDSSVAHLAGTETITGEKTFTAQQTFASDATFQGKVGVGVASPGAKFEVKDTITSGQKLAAFYEGNDMVFWIEKK